MANLSTWPWACLIIVYLLTDLAGATVHKKKSDWLTLTGDVAQIGLPVGAGYYSLQQKDRLGLSAFTKATALTLLEVHGLKYLIHAPRPHGGGNNSFPSGHSAAAFSGASYLWLRYGPEYGLPATALATVVGISRIHGNYHYTRDVLAGAILASLNQYWVLRHYDMQLLIAPNGILIKKTF